MIARPRRLAAVGNNNNLSAFLVLADGPINPVVGTGPGDINPIAYTLFNYKLPERAISDSLCKSERDRPEYHAIRRSSRRSRRTRKIPGTAYFIADQAVADLDWNPNSSHSFSAKYYYQHDPTTAPYAYSSVAGFPQHLDAGSQVVSLSHTQIVKPNLSVTETFGFIREKAYSTVGQPFTTAQFAHGVRELDRLCVRFRLHDQQVRFTRFSRHHDHLAGHRSSLLSAAFEYRRRGGVAWCVSQAYSKTVSILPPMPSGLLGRHTITFGGSFEYTQLNTRDRRNQLGDDRVGRHQPVSPGRTHRRLSLRRDVVL